MNADESPQHAKPTPPSSTDTHVPGDKWAFDESVAACFDDMLERSIPGYHDMRRLTFQVSQRYVTPRTDVVDLGASRGGAIADFVRKYGAINRYVCCEVSNPMLDALRDRFAGWIDSGCLQVRKHDLRQGVPFAKASVVLAVLTLQFTPIEYRQQILQSAFDHLDPGGALLVVEKILGRDAHADRLLVDCYYDLKREHGYSEDDIRRKKLALEGVLVPQTADANVAMLHAAGFQHVECYWRHLNFAGWVAVKP